MSNVRINSAILERWCWVAVYAVLGAVAFYWLLPAGKAVSAALSLPRPYRPWLYQPWFLWASAGGAIVALFFVLSEPLGVRGPAVRFTLRYPPLWVAVVLSLSLVAIVNRSAALRPTASRIEWGFDLPLVVLVGGAFTGVILSRIRLKRARPTSSEIVTGELDGSSFTEWAEREQPADNTDFFDRQRLVSRIARHLSSPSGHDETIAVLGPFGSGKTTMLGWVGRQLAQSDDPHVWVCRVSCWGLEASAAAPAHILSRMIETVESFVDCRNLRGLPQSYQRLVAATPTGVVRSIVETVGVRGDPVEQLQQLTPILLAANARLVLFIEDADRGGTDFDPQHIHRILWMLRSISGVSFVLAVDPEQVRFDFSKLCDHIEVLPTVSPDQVSRIFRKQRDRWMSDFTFIDPVLDRRKDDKLAFDEARGRLAAFAQLRYPSSLPDAIATLLPTPRKLKHVVRRSERVWRSLNGEIDPDDLLLANVLREGSPDCFDFLLRHLDAIRARKERLPGFEERSKELEDQWKDLLAKVKSPEAVQAVVDFLALQRLTTRDEKPRPQGIQHDEPTDYFRRLLAEEIGPNELRDQEVLREIDLWITRRDDALPARLAASTDDEARYVQVWEHFADLMPVPALRSLAEVVLGTIQVRDRHGASGKHPAILALWRRACQRLERGDETNRWLERLICNALPISLELANELYYFWTSVRYGPADFNGRKSIRRAVAAAARTAYPNAYALFTALDPARPWGLRQLVEPVDQDEPPSELKELRDWQWLSPLVLELIAKEGRIADEVVRLSGDFSSDMTVREDGPGIRESYSLKRASVETLFGTHARAVLQFLAQGPSEPWYMAAAREQAAQMLASEEGK